MTQVGKPCPRCLERRPFKRHVPMERCNGFWKCKMDDCGYEEPVDATPEIAEKE